MKWTKPPRFPKKKPKVYPISNPRITRECKRNDKQAPAMLNGSTKAQNVCFVRKKGSGSHNARHDNMQPKEGMNKTPYRCEEVSSKTMSKMSKKSIAGMQRPHVWVYG